MTRRRQRAKEVEIEPEEIEESEVEEDDSDEEEDESEDSPKQKGKKRGRKSSSSELIVNEKWMINSDANQWKVNLRTGENAWTPKAYLCSLSSCLKWLVEHEIRVSEYSTLKELADNVDSIKEEIGNFIEEQGLDPIW